MVNPMAPMMPLLQALTAPMLDPIRRLLPRHLDRLFAAGAADRAQVLLMVLARLSYGLMGV